VIEASSEFERPATTHIRCPKCRSADLSLTEVGDVSLTWHVKGGSFDRSKGYRDYGSLHTVFGNCTKCDHQWRLKRAIQITDVCKEEGE
jgi:Zn finger protein HypA/HybF involved in hydrogenase expression